MMPDGWTPCCVKQNIQLTKYKILRRSISMIMIADDEITYLKKKKRIKINIPIYIYKNIYIYIYLCLMIIIEKKEKKRGERIIKALSV